MDLAYNFVKYHPSSPGPFVDRQYHLRGQLLNSRLTLNSLHCVGYANMIFFYITETEAIGELELLG